MSSSHRSSGQRGLSVLEILIGCLIGAIGVLTVFQTVTVWSRHTQSTTAGGDADVSGTLAIFNLERDLKLGGLGFADAPTLFMGCTVNATNGAAAFSFPMVPIAITSGAGGAPDTIDVLYGNPSFSPVGQEIVASTATSKTMKRREGIKQGDLVLLAGTGSSGTTECSLLEITGTGNADGFTVDHQANVTYTNFYTSAAASAAYNPTTPYPAVTAPRMYTLGNVPRRNRWQIGAGGTLQRVDLIHATPAFDVSHGVVNLKAEYGVDANANGSIESGEWTMTPPTNWNSLLAVRIAVLVRSGQFERSPDAGASGVTGPVTTANPVWGNGNAAHTFLMTNVDGTADSNPSAAADLPNNWRYYRYRVYEKIVPLRNMIWS